MLVPEFAPGPVAFDRCVDEGEPSLARAAAVDRQRRRLPGDPARRAVEEGQELQALARGHRDRRVDAAPVIAALGRGLHDRPVDRPAHGADATGLHVGGVLVGQGRLRRDPEKGAGQRLRGGGRQQGGDKRQQGDDGLCGSQARCGRGVLVQVTS